MKNDIVLKAIERRRAALETVAKRKDGLVSYADFRLAASRRSKEPLKGFSSSRRKKNMTDTDAA